MSVTTTVVEYKCPCCDAGLDCGECRMPLDALTEENLEQLQLCIDCVCND